MRKLTLLISMLFLSVGMAWAQDYTPRETGVKAHATRLVGGISVGGDSYSLPSGTRYSYTDATEDKTFTIWAGETISLVMTQSGSWMNAFVYIDQDKNGFTAGIDTDGYTPTGDLVSYSFYNNGATSDASGYNSVGNSISGGNRSTLTLPNIVAPTTPGTYRIRFKYDWCNIDPAGGSGTYFGNTFTGHGGEIIDATLKVEDYPFEFVKSGKPTKWYNVALHPVQKNYISVNASGQATATTSLDGTLNSIWGFVGNPIDGFKLVNAAGKELVFGSPATVADENGTVFKVVKSSYGGSGFALQAPNSNQCLNPQSGLVKSWTLDQGCTVALQEAELPVAHINNVGYATLAAAYDAAVNGDVIVLNESVTTFPVIKKAVTFKGGKENAAVEINYALSQNFTAIDGIVRFENLTFNKPLFTEHGGNKPSLSIEFEGCNFNVNSEAGYGILIGTSWSNSVVKGLKVNNCNFKYVGTEFKGGYMLYVQCVNEVTITNNTIDGNNLYRGAIHLGDATEHATVATVSNNAIKNFCRGVMMGNRVVGSSATISGNTFDNINYSDKDSKPAHECAPIFIHSNATAEALQIALTNNEVENCANPMIYSEDTDLIKYYVTEFTGNTVAGAAVELANSYNAPNQIFPVATINDAEYFTLQAAIDAVQNSEEIVLQENCAEKVTFTQVADKSFVLNGNNKEFTGGITMTARAGKDAPSTLVIKNFNCKPTDGEDKFFVSTETNYYPNNVTIQDCTFEGSGADSNDVPVTIKSANNFVIKNCKANNVHSLLQNTAGWNITVSGCEVTNAGRGMALGSAQGVTIENVKIDASDEKYGIRVDAAYASTTTINNCEISAFIPVVARNASENYNFVFEGANTMTPANTDGLWCAISTEEYDENGEALPLPTGKVTVTLNGTGLSTEGLYGNYIAPVKIGETSYDSLADALAAANAMTGDVTVEVYGKVTLNSALAGNYSSIKFVGKEDDAEIYLDVQGYITATGKNVAFEDLTLSKSQGGFINNAGFMNVAFGIYDVAEVTYTNCEFANGAYAASGKVTYNGCTFKKSWEKYGLWAYGDVDVTVDGCKFDNDRGIKMYAEGAAKTTDLAVKNTDFSALTGKPAIVLTYGESVALEGNTYSETGTLELDLDGAPNGTAVTSDVTPVCKNDNGACGVLVDGKIYTTVAQAAEVAAEDSNVTLLYSTTDAVEFAEGVNLTLANGVTADNVTVATSGVAKVGDTTYATLAEAVAAAQAGDEIVLLGDVAEDATLPAGVKFNGNGKAVGNLIAGGEITFTGVTKATSFGVQYTNTTVNIVPGACLEITGTGRMVIGHGCTFNITGSIEDAKTADKATLVPSLKIAAGASITGNGVTFNVNDAYIVANANTTSKNKNANGTLDFNINNSIWEQTGVLAFYVPTEGMDPVVNFDLKNSVLTTTSHLVFSVTKGEIVFDNSLVNQGTSRQLENRSTMTIKNGSVVNGAVATSSNAINPGTIIVENATYAVTGEFSGAAEGTGTLIVKKGATVSAGSITKANIQIDATGMAAGDEVNLTANLSNLAGTIEVINNDNLDASIVDGKIVLAAKPVAKIDDTTYATLEEAFAAAAEGETITLLADATPALTSQSAITKAAVIDLGGNTLTLTEDDLYFGTTTFKNGTIVVDPSVKPSTAVFWMFANQTLTFDAVKVVATGVTGTYLIGLDGNNSDLNLLNGSEILIENTTALDLDVICVNASTGNDIVVENSKVNVTNLDGRVFFRGNYTVKDSEVSLAGITKAGFRIEAGQTLSIEGTSTVTVEGEPRDGGIHITDATATYTKAETATVNATVNAPAPAYVAKIGEQGYETLAAALEAANDGETVTLVWAEGDDAIAMNGAVCGNKTVTITGTANVDWSKGFFFVGRGATGNGKVIFNGANLTSVSNSSAYGFNVSGSKAGDDETNDGAIELVNSTIVLDYMLNKGTMSLDNSTLTVKNGFSVTGRKASESATGADATATMTLTNNSKVIVNNYNGMGIGHEAFGIMNIDATSTFEGTQNFVVAANGTMNVAAGGAVKVNGTLTVNGTLVSAGDIAATIVAGTGATIEISGGVYTQDVNEWCVDSYAALPDLNGNYVVGVKPTATVNNLGMTTVAAGDYSIWNGSFDQNTEDDGDMPLSFVMQFLADQTEADMTTSPYADWYGDFVITFTGIESGSFIADGCYLAGHYGSFGWVKVPVDGMEIEEGARYPVMLGVGMGQKYDYICSSVQDFKCALYLTPEILAANPNIEVKLELGVVDNSKGSDAAASALINNENVYSVTEYTYDAEDFVVDPNYIAELTIDDAAALKYENTVEKTVGTLTYERTLVEGIWNALYLPFKVPVEMLAENYEIAYYNTMHSYDNDNNGVFEEFEMEILKLTTGTLRANYPYFIRPKNAEACSLEIVLEDVTLYPAVEKVITTSSVLHTFKLFGTYKPLSQEELEGYYAVNYEGNWSASTGLKPYRLYLSIELNEDEGSSYAAVARSIRIVEGNDGTTGVEEITGENGEKMIFDLQGRRVLEPQKGGLYIVNGKKVLVK